ncbi:MAG: DUF2141 domain-containing protein [Lutibacter sp.]|nr:DUF2141 domain-containing protein [Lutibacter sp.]MDT8417479.1 DUF2141 domain-containing protein [Lutibacter sp.]
MQQVILAIALFISSMIFAQTATNKPEEGISVTVSAVNALSDNGTVKFALYDEENFMKQPIVSKSASVENRKSTVLFENVPEGNYAIICFHDENDNNQLDFEESGRPKESYGLSNNKMNFGPPEFESAKFEVKSNALILEIKF